MRDGAFGSFSGCYPLFVKDASHSTVIKNEAIPPFGEASLRSNAGHGAGENRVVPVHCPAFFWFERRKIGIDDAVNGVCSCSPLWLRIIQKISQCDSAMQSVTNAGASSEKCVIPWSGINFTGPQRKTILAAHAHDPIQCFAHCGP